jgi:hypothetical protein
VVVDNLVYNSGQWEWMNNRIDDKKSADIVFIYGDRDKVAQEDVFALLRTIYPDADIVGTSTSGNVLGNEVSHHAVVATAVSFDRANTVVASVDFHTGDDISQLSEALIAQLPTQNLKHIYVVADGLNLNGSELVRGINHITQGVSVSGGLAGDGDRFEKSMVICNEQAKEFRIVAVGFYGESLKVGTGCFAGWSEFGTDREVTRSVGNVLYELDGEPALDLYKRYLGEYADGLPNSGLRFPLSIRQNDGDPEVIRTLLAIDHQQKSITFAGDVPVGYTARLMKPDIDLLIDGAASAAKEIKEFNDKQGLGLVVSCVGRKIVMDQMIDEELEAVGEILGENVQLVGFYSYGEIAPFEEDKLYCELHNQTMTLTAIYED